MDQSFGITDDVVLNYASILINYDPKELTRCMRSDMLTTDQRHYVRSRIKVLRKDGTYREYYKRRELMK